MAGDELVIGADGRARPRWAAHDPLLRDYYDHEWGAPVTDERGLFERLCLEGFQSGLSWATILRKRPAFRRDSGLLVRPQAQRDSTPLRRLPMHMVLAKA